MEGEKRSVEENRRRRGLGTRRHVSQILKDMRHVYRYPKEKDSKESHRVQRKLLEADPDKFMARLAMLERAHEQAERKHGGAKAQPGARGTEAPTTADEGSERVLGLIDRLLDDWKGGA